MWLDRERAFQHGSRPEVDRLATQVDVLRHRGASVPELIGYLARGQVGFVEDRRRRLAEVVRRDPGEALTPSRATEIPDRVARVPEPTDRVGKTGASR